MQKIKQKIILAIIVIGCISSLRAHSYVQRLSVANVRSYITEYERIAKQDRWIKRGAVLSALSLGCLGIFALGYYATSSDDAHQASQATTEEMEASFRKAQTFFYEQWLAQQKRSALAVTYDIFVGNIKNIVGMSIAVSCSLYAREACNHMVDRISLWWHDGAREGMYNAFADVGSGIKLIKTFASGMRMNHNNVDRAFCKKQTMIAYRNLIDALERSLAMLSIDSSQSSKSWLCNQENGLFLATKALSESISLYQDDQTDAYYANMQKTLGNLSDIFTQTLNLHMSQEIAHG